MKTHFSLTYESLSLEPCSRFLASEISGGQNIFCGTVRSPNRGKEVLHLEYEAYEAMAHHIFQSIAEELAARWNVHSVFLTHRLGICLPAEITIVAAVATAHRKEAFESCAFLLESVKSRLPVWKKEQHADGHIWVSAFNK
jgi:molybdopterin synthase catalytic subunit